MNRATHKHKQCVERYRVRQKQTVAGTEHHVNKITHHIPQFHNITHTTYKKCDISQDDIQVHKSCLAHCSITTDFGRVRSPGKCLIMCSEH